MGKATPAPEKNERLGCNPRIWNWGQFRIPISRCWLEKHNFPITVIANKAPSRPSFNPLFVTRIKYKTEVLFGEVVLIVPSLENGERNGS